MAKKARTPAPPRKVQAPQRRVDQRRQRTAEERRTLWTSVAFAASGVAAIGIVAALFFAFGRGSGSGAPAPVDMSKLAGLQTGPAPWNAGADYLPDRMQPLGLTEIGAEGQGVVFHIHAHVDIFVNGKKKPVPENLALKQFLHEVRRFPFYAELDKALGGKLAALAEAGEHRPILETMLSPTGLGFADQPKGLMPFHAYDGVTCTAFEEHMVEAGQVVRDAGQRARLHFTVSPEHMDAFHGLFEEPAIVHALFGASPTHSLEHAFDLLADATGKQGSIRSTTGLMDTAFGVRYQIFNEAQAESPWLPTLISQAGATLMR